METSGKDTTDEVTSRSDGNRRKRKCKSDWPESSITTSSHKKTRKTKKQESTTNVASKRQGGGDPVAKLKDDSSRKDKRDTLTKDKRNVATKDKNSETKSKGSVVPETTQNTAESSLLQQSTSSLTGDQESAVGENDMANDDDDATEQMISQQPSFRIKGNIRETKKNKTEKCPRCGRGYTSKKRLENHYNKTTQTCNSVLETEETKNSNYNSEFSDTINTALTAQRMSDEELYALITKDTTPAECNAIWRRILKQSKTLKCQNEKCSHKANSVPAFKYHYERCGKVIEKLICPVCNKCYTTKPGLDYHLGTQHLVLTEPVKLYEEVDLTLSRRQAAIRAASNLTEGSGDPNDDVNTDEKGPHSPRGIDNISEVDWIAIRSAFKKHQEVKCPSSFCSLMFKSMSGLRYHMSKCKEIKTLTCGICKKQLTTSYRLQKHMSKVHGIGEEACVDSEYMIPKEMIAGSSDDEETKPKTQSKKVFFHSQLALEKAYQPILKKLAEELKSDDVVFIDWQPKIDSWATCDPKEFPQYAPAADLSVKYCFASSKAGPSPISQLTLFDAAHEDAIYGMTGVIFNVGGPVWSMGWAPIGDKSSDGIQYVAMAAYRTSDETHRMDIPLTHKGLIQVWSVAIGDQPQLPQLSLGIAHEYGCIRCMKWCPSGCATKPADPEVMGRLGLLALACSDGMLRILCIPYPDMLLERLNHVVDEVTNSNDVFIIPKSICCLLSPGNITNQSDFSALYGQCLDVEWFPRQPHSKIAGSFSNGTVTIWDLLTKSWLLKGSHDHCDVVLYPQQHITAHFSICRTISWCTDDPDYLFTGGYDKRLCLWDLKFPEEPVEKWDRGWCMDSTWPLLSPGVFCLEDLAIKSDLQIRNLALQEFLTGKPVAAIKSAAPQIGFSYTPWKTVVAVGTIKGDLVLKHFIPFVHFFRRPNSNKHGLKQNQLLCFTTRESSVEEEGEQMDTMTTTKDNSSTHTHHNNNKCVTFYNYPQEIEHQLEYKPDMEPVTAVTKVAWNPHHKHCDWLLVATNTGLVRLLKLSSQ